MNHQEELEALTGDNINVILDEIVGGTHWFVFRALETGKLHVIIRQDTGFVDVNPRNLEVVISKLTQMHIPYEVPSLRIVAPDAEGRGT